MLSDARVRRAVLGDVAALCEIENVSFSVAWSRDSFLAALGSDSVRVFVAEKQDVVVGFGCISVLCPEGEILNLAVLPEERRGGLGALLLSAMLENAAASDVEVVYLEARESNLPARTLYEKFGFLPIGVRKNYYARPTENAVVMQKLLRASRL